MKTPLASPRRFKFLVILYWLGIHACVVSAGVPLDPALARMPTVARITAAPVFENPLQFTSKQPPPAEESESLWAAIDVLREYGPAAGVPALELFVETYTNSAWIASVRNNLGYYYRSIGRYSLALEHWQAAWEASSLGTGNNAKGVADFALAHWTRLLASLGRREALDGIYQLTQGRLLDGGPLQQTFNATREGFSTMVREPGVAYRCGTLALWQVGKILQPGNTNVNSLLGVPSPETGFSVALLKSISDELRLNLMAVQRVAGSELVVPSVVHWKLDHLQPLPPEKVTATRFRTRRSSERFGWMQKQSTPKRAAFF